MTYYVTMTDKFMSGWGMAKNRINKLIFVCKDYQEAEIVKDNADARDEMKYVNICVNAPRYNENKYYTQFKTREDSANWYNPNMAWGK
jgi:hypothetical protein